MAAIDITIDVSQTQRSLATCVRQIPFAASTAINDVLQQVRVAETAAIAATFKHPRPFTARSVQYDKATKASLTGSVFVRPEVAKYLMPYEVGGVHVLPGTALLNPVIGNIRLDQYGQLPKSTMALLRARPDIFIGEIHGITGVWQRLAVNRKGTARRKRLPGSRAYTPLLGPLKLMIRFGNALQVTAHLLFQQRGVALIRTTFPGAFGTAFANAIATARP